MDRRNFLRISALATGAAALSQAPLAAAPRDEFPENKSAATPESWTIVSDETSGGVRSIEAIPSAKVCSTKVEIEINTKDRTIKDLHFTRGCAGNAKGLGLLAQGMKVSDVVARLRGVPCGRRGTSCPDQLARILESLKW